MDETLSRDGFMRTVYEQELKDEAGYTVQLWRAFLELPDTEKDRYKASIETRWNGYERKNGVGKNADRKENFDVSAGFIDKDIVDPVAERFITSAIAISKAMSVKALEVSRAIGEQYNIDYLRTLSSDQLDTIVRYLYYPPDRSDEELLGEPHVDQSGLTFHLAETTGGCEYLDRTERRWKPLVVGSGEGIAFGAMQLQYLSENEIPALTHRIVPNEVSRLQGRIAIVCFTRYKHPVPMYDKETHGRLQEFEPGFQYDVSVDDFRKLFRP